MTTESLGCAACWCRRLLLRAVRFAVFKATADAQLLGAGAGAGSAAQAEGGEVLEVGELLHARVSEAAAVVLEEQPVVFKVVVEAHHGADIEGGEVLENGQLLQARVGDLRVKKLD